MLTLRSGVFYLGYVLITFSLSTSFILLVSASEAQR